MRDKKNRYRFPAVLLAAVLLLQTWVLAAPPVRFDDAGSTASGTASEAAEDDSVINGVPIPNTWAREALAFAVRNGILAGKNGTDLCPGDSATRAEMATMMVRILGTSQQADLSVYSDCLSGKWYYAPMAAAVHMGLFKGTSATTLSPNSAITREQAFTVLARAFGMTDESSDLLSRFSDWGDVSSYAVGPTAALVKAGYVAGSGGKLCPKNKISRQELAQVLYDILGEFYREGDTAKAEYQNLLYTAATPLPEGTVIHGDLLINCDAGDTVTLRGLTVEGRIVIRGDNRRTITAENCTCATLVLLCPADLTFDHLSALRVSAPAVVSGTLDTLQAADDCTFSGNCADAVLSSGNLTVTEGSTLSKLTVLHDAAGAVITVNGTVTACDVYARRVQLTGSGQADTVTLHRPGCTVSCVCPELVDQIDAGIEDILVTQVSVPTASPASPRAGVTVCFTGIDTTQCYGVSGSARLCTLEWYCGSKLVAAQRNFELKDNVKATCTVQLAFYRGMPAEYPVTLRVLYQDEVVEKTLYVHADNYSDAHYEALNVRTIHVQGVVLRTATVYRNSSLTSSTGKTVTAGQVVNYLGYGVANWIQLADGTKGYIATGTLSVRDKVYYSTTTSYSAAAREAFVNEIRSYSSSTRYLIWCNLYTQTLSIFEGSRDNWSLIKTCRCASGGNYSPTRPGEYTIYAKTNRWDFDDDTYYVLYPSLFDGGCAFHTRTRLTDGDDLLDSRLGMTISHGCVRLPDEYAVWIYRNCGFGTKVVIF